MNTFSMQSGARGELLTASRGAETMECSFAITSPSVWISVSLKQGFQYSDQIYKLGRFKNDMISSKGIIRIGSCID